MKEKTEGTNLKRNADLSGLSGNLLNSRTDRQFFRPKPY